MTVNPTVCDGYVMLINITDLHVVMITWCNP